MLAFLFAIAAHACAMPRPDSVDAAMLHRFAYAPSTRGFTEMLAFALAFVAGQHLYTALNALFSRGTLLANKAVEHSPV